MTVESVTTNDRTSELGLISTREDIQLRFLKILEAIAENPSIEEKYGKNWIIVDDRKSSGVLDFIKLLKTNEPIFNNFNRYVKITFLNKLNNQYFSFILSKNDFISIEDELSL
jgi:hypothetical protein